MRNCFVHSALSQSLILKVKRLFLLSLCLSPDDWKLWTLPSPWLGRPWGLVGSRDKAHPWASHPDEHLGALGWVESNDWLTTGDRSGPEAPGWALACFLDHQRQLHLQGGTGAKSSTGAPEGFGSPSCPWENCRSSPVLGWVKVLAKSSSTSCWPTYWPLQLLFVFIGACELEIVGRSRFFAVPRINF